MKRVFTIISCIMMFAFIFTVNAQKSNNSTHISGHIKNNDKSLSFINVTVEGTTLGAYTDVSGYYHIHDVPTGEITLIASAIGYKTKQQTITISEGSSTEVNFELNEDVLGLDEIVVSSERNKLNRSESALIVNSISSREFNASQSVNMGEAINFVTGLQLETNCQSCGFTQVRMNGLPGSYSQMLINSRPIFSGLLSVYGLELIPSNMIERIEVVRGGGSALFGGNAIAGTINIILKEPITNSYEFDLSTGLAGVGVKDGGNPAFDNNARFNTTLVSKSMKTGMSLYGFYRKRDPFDANGDDISELTLQENTTIGSQFTHRFGSKSKLDINFFNITEERRGGNKFDSPLHESDITEYAKHHVTSGSVTFLRYLRDLDILTVYSSGQYVDRDSYYGTKEIASGYGNSKSINSNVGFQYKLQLNKSSLTFGLENTTGMLEDNKLGFMDIYGAEIEEDSIISVPHTENVVISDQNTNTIGGFSNFKIQLNNLTLSAGLRLDNFYIRDNIHKGLPYSEKNGLVISPKLNLLYNISPNLQGRFNYSHGYRAPQMYDEELHVMVSGASLITHKNSPDLKEETSHSFLLSLNYKSDAIISHDFLTELFFIRLEDPFANEYISLNDGEFMTYRRVNAEDGAQVYGVNVEYNVALSNDFIFNLGMTYKQSYYDVPQDFDEKRFVRSPDTYGYLTCIYNPIKSFDLSITANYTGTMLTAHEGVDPDTDDPNELLAIENGDVIAGRMLEETNSFIDIGLKATYKIELEDASLHIYGGVKNMLNSYQNDHDKGPFRDSAYIYGPNLPRSVFIGIKLVNLL